MDTIKKVCAKCGKKFSCISPNQKFCSIECGYNQHGYIKKGRVKRICEFCGKEYMARNFVTRTGAYQKFCSIECQHEGTRKRNLEFKERDFTVQT